jgi:hypothetical protein
VPSNFAEADVFVTSLKPTVIKTDEVTEGTAMPRCSGGQLRTDAGGLETAVHFY